MRRPSGSLVLSHALTLGLLAGAAGAQVEFIYTNISSAAGAYRDAIVLWGPAGQRPLAQESGIQPGGTVVGRQATGSAKKMKLRDDQGRNYLYWIDGIVDDVMRGTDRNRNGVIDPTEFESAFDFDALSEGSLDEFNGVWWACNGAASGTTAGLWRFVDGNGNGNFKDTGEATRLVAGPTFTLTNPPVNGVSSDDMRAVAVMANGDCIWHEDDTPAWFRTTPAGVTSLFLAYKTTAPVLPLNPDFGTSLPAIGANSADRVAVDRANDRVYVALNFTVAVPQPFVFGCKDGNANGNVNDAGEVKLFYDGLTGPVAMTSIDDIEFFAGSVYVSHEKNAATGGPCEFVRLTDGNNDGDAMDTGEQTVVGATATTPLDDPSVIGITVVPAGSFGSSCVNADLDSTPMTSAGGTVTFTLNDIPVALHNDNVFGFVLLGVSGDAAVTLPDGCVLGLVPDFITVATLPALLTGPITARLRATTPLPYPPGLLGAKIWHAAFFLRTTDMTFKGVTHSSLIEIKT